MAYKRKPDPERLAKTYECAGLTVLAEKTRALIPSTINDPAAGNTKPLPQIAETGQTEQQVSLDTMPANHGNNDFEPSPDCEQTKDLSFVPMLRCDYMSQAFSIEELSEIYQQPVPVIIEYTFDLPPIPNLPKHNHKQLGNGLGLAAALLTDPQTPINDETIKAAQDMLNAGLRMANIAMDKSVQTDKSVQSDDITGQTNNMNKACNSANGQAMDKSVPGMDKTVQGRGEEISTQLSIPGSANPLRSEFIQALQTHGLTPDKAAQEMTTRMLRSKDNGFIGFMQCYLRVIGGYLGQSDRPNIGKLAQIIQLPANTRLG
jgi:hypothetical protein